MNLVLLSTFNPNSNIKNMKKIYSKITSMANPKNTTVGYLSYYTDAELTRFEKTKRCYSNLGYKRFRCFDLDEKYKLNSLDELLKCNLIHIPGGNTFDLLNLINKYNLLDKLRLFVKNGGVLVGVSAGSILISPSISVAKFADENVEDIENLNALNLIDFTLKPHWQNWEDKSLLFKEFSRDSNLKVYTLKDGEGIVIKNNEKYLFIDEKRNDIIISA